MRGLTSVLALFVTSIASFVLAQSDISAQNATVFALTYGYPLLAYEKVLIQINATGANKFLHFRQLQGPGNTAVVKPNVDTLYSSLVFDLSESDVIITVPKGIPADQFVLFSFFDPFGTNFANVGTLNFNNSGQYRLQPRTANSTSGVRPTNDTSSPYQAYVHSSSIYGFVLIRWLVNNTNINAINSWQDQTLVQNLSSSSRRAPPIRSLPVAVQSESPAQNVLNLLAAFAPYTLPESSAEATRVNRTLAAAGIANGTYRAPQGVNLTQANQTTLSAISASAAAPNAVTRLNNGWTVANSSLIGLFGDNYAFRSAVAASGYLALRPPNTIYPSWSNSSSAAPLGGDFALASGDALLFTFSSKPPLLPAGFWSLTAYQNNYLINNTRNVYAITRERSNITYADGSLVYGTNSSSSTNATRPFQILVQAADKAPPANWTGNWLPGPAGGGNISLTLRFYDAQQSLLDGRYDYPLVTRRAAIVGNGTSNGTSSGTGNGTSGTPSSSGGPSGTGASAPTSSTARPSSGVRYTASASVTLVLCLVLALLLAY